MLWLVADYYMDAPRMHDWKPKVCVIAYITRRFRVAHLAHSFSAEFREKGDEWRIHGINGVTVLVENDLIFNCVWRARGDAKATQMPLVMVK